MIQFVFTIQCVFYLCVSRYIHVLSGGLYHACVGESVFVGVSVCVGGLCQEHLLRHGPDGVCVRSLVLKHELHSSSSSSPLPSAPLLQ